MQRILLMAIAFIFSIVVMAQENGNGKGKSKQKNKENTEVTSAKKEKNKGDIKDKAEHEKKVWEGTYSDKGKGPKPSKNQPAKVRSSFWKDYPNATDVSWSKYRGDWTAAFRNGPFLSTAVYHANGDRRDTRTPVTKNEMPAIILDSIFKKRPETRLEDIIKIQVPNVVKDIFRVKDIIQGKSQYLFYNSDGVEVKYDY